VAWDDEEGSLERDINIITATTTKAALKPPAATRSSRVRLRGAASKGRTTGELVCAPYWWKLREPDSGGRGEKGKGVGG
jgi:hypothetical protein